MSFAPWGEAKDMKLVPTSGRELGETFFDKLSRRGLPAAVWSISPLFRLRLCGDVPFSGQGRQKRGGGAFPELENPPFNGYNKGRQARQND